MFLAVFVVFGRVISHEFVRWDDVSLICDNPFVNPPTWRGFVGTWQTPHEGLFIPVTYDCWAVLAAIGRGIAWMNGPGLHGLKAWPYHLANLIMHAVNAVLVLRILHRYSSLPLVASVLGSLVFALHPIQSEAVCWATGMKDILSTFFALGGICAYLAAASSWQRQQMAAGHLRYSASLVLIFLGSLAKPGIVGVPVIAAILDLAFITPSFRRCVLRLVLPILVLVPAIAMTALQQGENVAEAAPLAFRPLIATHALGFYLSKLFVPRDFATDYGLRPLVVILDWRQTLLALVVPSYLTLMLVSKKFRRELAIAGAILLAGVAPVLGLKPFYFQWYSTVADRYMYLSMLGPAVAVGMLCHRGRQSIIAIIIPCICVSLAAISFAQVGYWRNTVTLMSRTAQINPNASAAYHNLAGAVIVPFIEDNTLPKGAGGLPSTPAMRSAVELAEQFLQAQMQARPAVMGPLRNLILLTAFRCDLKGAIELNKLAYRDAWRFRWDIGKGALSYIEFAQLYSAAKDWRSALMWLAVAQRNEPNYAAIRGCLDEVAQLMHEEATTRPLPKPSEDIGRGVKPAAGSRTGVPAEAQP